MADENKEDELVVVEVDEEGKAPETITEESKEPVKADADAADQDDDEDDEDDRLATSQDDSDAEISEAAKKRKRRRQQQKAARERAEAERAALLERNRALEERLNRLEGVTIGHTVNTLDTRIQKIEEDIRRAEHIMESAMEAGNTRDHMAALRIRDQAKDELRELQGVKRQVASQAETKTAEGPKPEVASLAQNWAQANSAWFNPRGGDTASDTALRIDAEMTRDGVFDPSTRAYWVELTRRVNAELAGVADDDGDEKPQKTGARKGPPVGSGKNSAPATKKNEVYVTPARKQAMIEAGVWDDPVRRQAYLRSYQEYDSQQAASR